MKTIGFLGGMTYYSTALYYSKINARVQVLRGGANAASIILHSFNFAEISQLFAAGDWASVTTRFVAAGKHMKAAGAQGLVIGCNIAHKVAPAVEAGAGLPVLHIADFTARALRQRGHKKVALLATKSAMEGDFIRGPLREQAGVEVLVPGLEDRQAIDDAVFKEFATGNVRPETRDLIRRIALDLVDQGAESVVLACTDLQFALKPDEVPVPLLDTLEIHADGLAEWAVEEEERQNR